MKTNVDTISHIRSRKLLTSRPPQVNRCKKAPAPKLRRINRFEILELEHDEGRGEGDDQRDAHVTRWSLVAESRCAAAIVVHHRPWSSREPAAVHDVSSNGAAPFHQQNARTTVRGSRTRRARLPGNPLADEPLYRYHGTGEATHRAAVPNASAGRTPKRKSSNVPPTSTGVARLKNCGTLGRGTNRTLTSLVAISAVPLPSVRVLAVSITRRPLRQLALLEVELADDELDRGVLVPISGRSRNRRFTDHRSNTPPGQLFGPTTKSKRPEPVAKAAESRGAVASSWKSRLSAPSRSAPRTDGPVDEHAVVVEVIDLEQRSPRPRRAARPGTSEPRADPGHGSRPRPGQWLRALSPTAAASSRPRPRSVRRRTTRASYEV